MLGLLLSASLSLQSPAIQKQLDSWVAAHEVPGASLALAFADGSSESWAAGFADLETQEAMTPQHRLMSGSIGKTYFAALFLDLIAEGTLSADDKLKKWLGKEDWYSSLPNAAAITLRQLAQHTSGIPEHVHLEQFWKDVRAQPQKVWLPEELVAYILDADPLFAAGSDWSYADTNFILLGMAMERAMGRSAYREVYRRFLQPLDLHDTIPTTSADLPGLSQGYHILGEADWLVPEETLHEGKMILNPQMEWCGGGYCSTTTDLARWGQLLFSGKAAPMAQLQASLAEAVPAKLGPGTRYGYGVILSETPLGPAWGHQGWFPGYLSELLYFPEHGFAIALQVNTDDIRSIGPLGPMLGAVAETVLRERDRETPTE